MKKKLLTVLLAVVMVFGVFGLTACGGSNPADDYNYYRSVYSSLAEEDDVRIHAMVFLGFEMMAKNTANTYLVYTGGAWDSKAQSNIKALNDLAIKYDVQVYNLDLKLDGGVSAVETAAKYTKETLTDGTVLNYAENLYLNSDSIISTKTAGIKAALLAAGMDADKDGKIDEATLFAVKGGKVVSSGKDNIAAGNTAASMEKAIQIGAIKLPSYAAGAASGAYKAEGFDTSNIKAFDYFGDNRLHMGDEEGVDQFDGVDSVYEVITLHGFLDVLKNCKGDYSVFFGGAWCPNTQAIATLTNDAAKGMGVSRVFFYDPNLDGSSSAGKGINTRTSNCNKPTFSATEVQDNGKPVVDSLDINAGWSNFRNSYNSQGSALTVSNAVFSGLYAKLVDSIAAGGTEYKSYWNEGLNSRNDTLWINGAAYSRMCVPNIMAFSYNEDKKCGQLTNWKEAEYYWANTGVEGDPYREAWFNASIEIMEENAYSSAYVAPMVVEESTDNGSTGGSSGGSTGGDAGGGC